MYAYVLSLFSKAGHRLLIERRHFLLLHTQYAKRRLVWLVNLVCLVYFVDLVYLVCLVCLVCLVYLVYLVCLVGRCVS